MGGTAFELGVEFAGVYRVSPAAAIVGKSARLMLEKRIVVPKTRMEKPAGQVQSQQTGYSTRLRLPQILPAIGSFLYSQPVSRGRLAPVRPTKLRPVPFVPRLLNRYSRSYQTASIMIAFTRDMIAALIGSGMVSQCLRSSARSG
jgi:hypothetical protein